MFFVLVNITNITEWEVEEEPWSSVEKSVIVVILSIQIVLGILGNCLVLIVKMVVRTMIELFREMLLLISEQLKRTDSSHYLCITIEPSLYTLYTIYTEKMVNIQICKTSNSDLFILYRNIKAKLHLQGGLTPDRHLPDQIVCTVKDFLHTNVRNDHREGVFVFI